MKICPDCGAEIDEQKQSCEWCGYSFVMQDISPGKPDISTPAESFTEETKDITPSYSTEPAPSQKTAASVKGSNKTFGVLIAVVAVLVLMLMILSILLIFFVFRQPGNQKSDSETIVTEMEMLSPAETSAQTEIVETLEETVTDVVTEPVTEATKTASIDYDAAYHQLLTYYENTDSDSYFYHYSLFDINNDGVLELITCSGTCEADAKAEFWDINGRKLGETGYGHSMFETDGTYLYLNGSHMGYQWIYKITLSGGSIVDTEEFSGEPTMDENYDYDYRSMGTAIPVYDYSDIVPLSSTETQ